MKPSRKGNYSQDRNYDNCAVSPRGPNEIKPNVKSIIGLGFPTPNLDLS